MTTAWREEKGRLADTQKLKEQLEEVLDTLTEREENVEDVAAVVWVGPAEATSKIGEELRDAGLEGHQINIVGDAFAPRRLANALVEAHTAARAIGSRSRV